MEPEDSNTVLVRSATATDFQAIGAFIHLFVVQGKLLPRTEDELEDLIEHGFIAERTGRLVGFAALEVYSRKLAEIRSLAVAAECRGMGIGKQLVQACIQRAHERDILEVMAVTSEETFFKGCGFDFTLPGEKKALFIQTRE